MIVCEHVAKQHRTGSLLVPALRDINCEIAGEVCTFIVGPSGSGKSTLLYLIGWLDAPTSGRIVVGGRDLSSMSVTERDQYRRQEVGFIFQNFNLLGNLDAVQNVLVPFLPQGITSHQRRQAIEHLERFGLGDRLGHRPSQLSGGEQQRVAIARALMKKPRLILADEPTGELDSENGTLIQNDLRRASAEMGTTVVIVTHESEFRLPSEPVLRIRDGVVQQ